MQSKVSKKYEDQDPKGTVVRTPTGLKSFIQMEAGSWFGDDSLFRDVVWQSTVSSVDHTVLLTITKTTLLNLLQRFPKATLCYKGFQRRIMQGDLIGAGLIC